MTKLRVVYMGTPDFAVPALEKIAEVHDVVGVVTNPDRPSGRGKKVHKTPVKVAAEKIGAPVFQPLKMRKNREALEQLRAWNPDVAVVAAYGQILPQTILDVPRLGCVNIHASLLPELRGAAPINWAIVRGHQKSGVTTMQMEAGLDTGPMLLKQEVEIGRFDTAQTLHDALSALGAEMILPTLAGLADGSIEPVPQNDEVSTYAPMMSKADGRIDWNATSRQVCDLIRGMNPWPGAFAQFGNDTIKFHLAKREESVNENIGAAGEVIETRGQLTIACGDGAISVIEIQAPNSKRVTGVDFVNGMRIAKGDKFT